MVSPKALAVPITWGFEGFTDGEGLPGGICLPLGCADILFDTYFSGTITFDSDAPDQDPDPFRGFYTSSGAGFGFTLEIGDYTYQTDIVEIGIRAEPLAGPQFFIFADQDDTWFSRIGLGICYDNNTGVLTSDDLPGEPPPLSPFGCNDPSFLTTVDNFDIALNVTRYFLVPEPSTLSLVTLVLAAFGLRRKPTNSQP